MLEKVFLLIDFSENFLCERLRFPPKRLGREFPLGFHVSLPCVLVHKLDPSLGMKVVAIMLS
jgi:hypothetical protein